MLQPRSTPLARPCAFLMFIGGGSASTTTTTTATSSNNSNKIANAATGAAAATTNNDNNSHQRETRVTKRRCQLHQRGKRHSFHLLLLLPLLFHCLLQSAHTIQITGGGPDPSVHAGGVGTEVRNTNAKCAATLGEKTDELVKRQKWSKEN